VDSLELLSLIIGYENTLMFVKQIKVLPNAFPFFAHVDTGLILSKDDHFKLRLMKLSNGGIRVTKDG
jgi:hypothetical protein